MRRWVMMGILLACTPAITLAQEACGFACGDLDGDGAIGLADFTAFAACMDDGTPADVCQCADLNGSGEIDLRDFALHAQVFGRSSDELPPACTGAVGSTVNLTAYRPQHGGGYFPFTRTAVPDADEEDELRGPGIRLNGPGDADPAGEDDLVEVVLTVDPPGVPLALRRSDPSIAVWTTRDRREGTQIAFDEDRTDLLPLPPGATTFTLWVEWVAGAPGTAILAVEPAGAALVKDLLRLHRFKSIIIALGGESQAPSVPVDPNHGTFVVGTAFYELGYDVHMFDEDVVAADGAGLAYDAVADAVVNRSVDEVGIFGYSHGGGSTYHLADRLDVNRAGLGLFDIKVTAYADSVRNNSDVDTAMELRRPPSTALHVNHYQNGTLFEDFFLDGGPVPNSVPPPTGLDVETTSWGANATHFEVDDFLQVRARIETELLSGISR